MKGKNLTNIVTNKNSSHVKGWVDFILKELKEYILISECSMLGLMTIILLK